MPRINLSKQQKLEEINIRDTQRYAYISDNKIEDVTYDLSNAKNLKKINGIRIRK